MIDLVEAIGSLVVGTFSLAAILLISETVLMQTLAGPQDTRILRGLHLMASSCLAAMSLCAGRMIPHL